MEAQATSNASPTRQEPSPALADNWNQPGRPTPLPARHNELLETGLADTRNAFGAPSCSPGESAWSGSTEPLPLATAGNNELQWQDFVGHSRGEQAKSMLAAIGIISILLFASRVMLAGS